MNREGVWRATLILSACSLFSGPVVAQSALPWNMYGGGGSFFVPLTTEPNPAGGPNQVFVSLTLNGYGPKNFILDTGSLGLVADGKHYKPGNDPVLAPYASISYGTSNAGSDGTIYLTNVQINGANGQSVTARVPILATTKDGFHQMGIGFDRGGVMVDPYLGAPKKLQQAANNSWNMNPLLSLVSGPGVSSTMQPGYIIGMSGFPSLGLGNTPGILLGLNSQNTSGFAFQNLPSSGTNLSWYSIGGTAYPVQWGSQNGSVSITVEGQPRYDLGTLNQLPDSGISYMIVTAPTAGQVPVGRGQCSARTQAENNCLQPGGTVQVFLPGQTTAAYSFILGDSSSILPYGVQVTDGPGFTNLGRTFFENLNYLYDPMNGFVGYSVPVSRDYRGNGSIVQMLALQGMLNLPDAFQASFTTYLMDNVTVQVQQNGSALLNGSIWGPGGLTLGSGNLTLGGAGTYTGGTTVNGGLLTIANTGSILGDVTVNNGGGLVNNGTIGGNGQLTVNAGGSFVNNGTVDTPLQWQLNSGNFTNNGAFNASLANLGLAANGGTLTGSVFNGSLGQFSNTGTITGNVTNMGLFAQNGTIAGNVNNMGVLSGTGTIFGNVTNAGVVAPGNSIGTLSVTGNYTQTGGTFQAEVNATRQSDRLNATGTATIGAGSTVVVLPQAGSYAPRTTYTLLNATGGLTGTYASVSSALPFLQPSLSYDANNVYLSLQVGGFAQAALTPNQAAVGAVLDSTALNATGDYATVIGALSTLSAQQGQAVMNAISGQNYSGFSSSMAQGIQLFLSNFAGQAGGGGSLTGSSRVALAEACDVACDSTVPALWSAWGGMLGGLGTMSSGSSNAGTLTYSAGGFAGGLDRLVAPGLRVGVTAGYQNANQWVGGFSGQGNSNSFQAGLYANFIQDKVYADAIAGYAYSANQMWRSIAIPGLAPRTAIGNTGANQFYGQVETGYRFDLGGLADAFVTPFVRLQAYTGTQNAFTETGAGSLNLSVAQQTTNSLRTVLGAQLGGSMDVGWRDRLALKMRLGWSHEYADTARPVTASFAGAPVAPFTTYGVAPQRDGVVLGLAANTAVADATSIYLRYEGEVSGQDNAHAFTAGFRMTW
ncbi:autotransporter domain-containing protein [Reyranella aquatilis]|uniref:Autotransporter domain-containing protein n=1 Tax=Reyranella aquatilis TaxID=2035356 RepID=A0ABS8KRJ6_9HYPH|nr:autotransporter outer membrane beta-barrel domain-containing protein [Reyranella aquatilis]MCC8428674.1 autotransporter domain-containing protein [Reyranella aquatilis]